MLPVLIAAGAAIIGIGHLTGKDAAEKKILNSVKTGKGRDSMDPYVSEAVARGFANMAKERTETGELQYLREDVYESEDDPDVSDDEDIEEDE